MMDIDPRDVREIDARLTDVVAAYHLQQRAAEIRDSKVPTPGFSFVDSVPGAIGATAAYLCGGDLFRMAGNGIKELRARAHERLANQILGD